MTDPPEIVVEQDANSTSFREIVEEHKRAVYFLCLDLTGNHHDAEDLSQDVFIKAYRGLSSFRGESSLTTWLRRIAINTYLTARKKKSRALMTFLHNTDDASEDGYARSLADSRPSPDRTADGAIAQLHLERAMRRLSPRERSAFVLRHYQDLTVPDVAVAMGVSAGTVKSLLFRATRKMERTLAFYRKDIAEV